MAFQSIWYFTNLPKKVVDIIEEDLSENFDGSMVDSQILSKDINKKKRNSKNSGFYTKQFCLHVAHKR